MSQLIFFCFIVFVFCSELENHQRPGNFNLFHGDIFIHIGQFLLVPQKEMGILNKAANEALYRQYPFRRLIGNRIGIKELFESGFDAELLVLKHLSFSSDPFHNLQAIGQALICQNALSQNAVIISRYILRVYTRISAELIPKITDSEMNNISSFAFNAVRRRDYDLLVKLFSVFPNCLDQFITSTFPQNHSMFVKTVIEDDEAERIFSLFFNSLSSEKNQSNFLLNSIIRRAPEAYYWRFLTETTGLAENILNLIFTNNLGNLDDYDTFACFDTISRLLDQIETEMEKNSENDTGFNRRDLELNRLLNRIRFDASAYIDFEAEIEPRQLDHYELEKLMIAAIYGNRPALAHQIFADERMAAFNTASEYMNLTFEKDCRIHLIINCFHLFSKFEQHNFFNDEKFLRLLTSFYDAQRCSKIENGVFVVNFRVKSTILHHYLASSFDYILTNSYDGIKPCIPKFLLQINIFTDEGSLLALIESLFSCEIIKRYQISSILIQFENASLILKSASLQNLLREAGVELDIFEPVFARLLNESVAPLKGILVSHQDESLLTILSSKKQFQHLEEYFDKNIADILIDKEIFTVDQLEHSQVFFRIRFALHYWLEGPHRDRLFDEKVPAEIRALLAKEVCNEDQRFLLQEFE